MVRSMTGYGKCQSVTEEKEINIEIKSVNHRYLDLNFKLPRFLAFVEDRLRGMISQYVQRGKIEVFVSVASGEESGKAVMVDKDLAQSYLAAAQELSAQFGIQNDLAVSHLLGCDVFKVEHPQQDDDSLWAQLEPLFVKCFEEYNVMRQREGQRLKDDIGQKIALILEKIALIEKIIPENIQGYQERLLSKIKETLMDTQIDENRIIMEVAIYTDKICVDEELVRLKSHITELGHILEKGGTVGKKLDFIIQEMNREINTIGSKSNELKITQIVIDVKTEIEKIREQIQNIE